MKRGLVATGVLVLALYLRAVTMSVEASPEVPAMRVIRGAMHVHSSLSHDAKQTPEEMAKDARAAGLDLLIVTDHNARLEGSRYEDGILLIAASERSTPEGHVLEVGDFTVAAHPDSAKHPMNDEAVIGLRGYELGSSSSDFYALLRSPRIFWLTAYPLNHRATLAAMYPSRSPGADRYDRIAKAHRQKLVCGVDDHGKVPGTERLLTYVTYFPTLVPMGDAERDAMAVSAALSAGETFCALGIFGDASPLSLSLSSDAAVVAPMGGDHPLPVRVKVRWPSESLPTGHKVYLYKEGVLIRESTEARFEQLIAEPGMYRVEIGRNVSTLLGSRHVRWIYGNPFFVSPGLASL
jgi:PHP domain